MSYTELLDRDATENEIRSYVVDGETVAVTMRIPKNLRDSIKEAAALRGISLTAFVKMCLINELANKE